MEIPTGYTTVTPWMVTHDTAQLLDFVTRAFDAVELARVPGPDGGIGHAEFRIGDAIVMAFDSRPRYPVTPAFLRLFVADGQAVWDRAVAAGAAGITRMTMTPWGDLTGRVQDPQGNVYWLQERVEEVASDEMLRRMQEPEYVAAMDYLQSADFFSASR